MSPRPSTTGALAFVAALARDGGAGAKAAQAKITRTVHLGAPGRKR